MPRPLLQRPLLQRHLRVLTSASLLALFAVHAHATVEYTLTPQPSSRQFDVRIEIPDAKESETFRIPAWSPGFYFLQEYRRKLSTIKATDPDGNLLSIASNGNAWTVSNPEKKPIRFTYRVLGDDKGLGFFGAHLDSRTGFINGPSTFMYLDGRKEEDTRLRIRNPEGWKIATAMKSTGEETFTAGGYDEFIDHPIQLGEFESREFKIGDVPHKVIWVSPNGTYRANLDEETERIRKGYTIAPKIFGSTGFNQYITIVHLAVGDFSGGLEHRACNVQAVFNSDVLHLDDLATHEYFHAWNVKQIRPAVLGPFDYTQKVRTANLWFSEGVTDYYAKTTAYQSGLKGEGWLFDQFTSAANEVANSVQAKRMTIEEVSKNAWENGGFGVGDLSYYTKGLLAGLVFDAEIRGKSNGKKSLDDVMRLLWERHRLPKPGFGEDELRAVMIEVGGPTLGPLYDSVIRAAKPVDYSPLAGIGLRVAEPGQRLLLPRFQTSEAGIVTAIALKDDPVKVGDKILSMKLVENDSAEIRLQRGAETLTVTAPLTVTTTADIRIAPDPFATAEKKALREAWLKGPG